jgi:hypothetical protein
LILQQLGGHAVVAVQQAVPRAVLVGAEAELDQQPQVPVVGLELAVVQRLAVVGVGARLEQHPREREPLRVRRLVAPVLAATESAGQRRERVGAFPEVARVRVRAVVEQQPRDRHRVTADA